MKWISIFSFIILPFFTFAQSEYNSQKDYLAEGYDVVAYFSQKAVKGTSKYTTTHQGVKLKFESQKNLELFESNPQKYLPQYGGYCAYAMGKTGEKVSINPKTFEIRGGKLYLFYNAFLTNTLEKWVEEGAEELRAKADQNWKNQH